MTIRAGALTGLMNQPTAQVIDGSVLIDGHYGGSYPGKVLDRTPSVAGNNRTWTLSYWWKKIDNGAGQEQMFVAGTGPAVRTQLYLTDHTLRAYHTESPEGTNSFILQSYLSPAPRYRDFGPGWYHMCWVSDLPNGTFKCYVNNVLDIDGSVNSSYITQVNKTHKHTIGNHSFSDYNNPFTGRLSQMYMIDGKALDPSYFGFTDPLTNTWKPKQYTGTFEIASGTPSVSNGGLVIKADGATINGTFGVGGGVKTWTSSDGVTWTRDGSGRTGSAAKYLAVGGAGTAFRTFYPDSGGFTFLMYNGGGEFDGSGSSFTLDLSSQTYSSSQTTNVGTNGFYLPFDGNSPIGKDMSGRGNDWTPVNFGGSVALDNPIVSGARPILNTTPGGTRAGVGVFGSKENKFYTVSSSSGGGNPYIFDNEGTQPTFNFIRGATYRFDYTSATSHPLRFATAADAAGSSQYTQGTDTSVSNVITITVPHDAPDTLYYYCTNHSGMGNSISVTTDNTKADQYASSCTLALPLVSSDVDVCASIACTANNKTATNSSVDASTAESNFYGGSHHWSANSDTLQYAEQGDELVFGTGDYTIEFWFYDDSGHSGGGGGRNYLFDNRIGGSVVGDPPTIAGWIDSSNEINFYSSDGAIEHSVPSTNDRWIHYAAVRSSGTTTLYLDGIAVGSVSGSTNFTNNGIGVGRATDGGYGMAGYIQDFRVYRGVAKYTSDFVVPSTSPDILPDTPSGVVGSSKLTKIIDGAVHFDGNGYLFAGSSSDYTFGTGDFTIEGYFYFDNSTTSPNDGLWQISGTSGGLQGANSTLSCNYETSGGRTRQLFFGSAGGWRQGGADNEFLPFMWNHVAEVRSSGTISVYINGKLSQSWSDTTNYTFTDCVVGAYYSTSYRWNGYVSNFRVLKGTALYTSNFTPPTRELTNVTNTKLLTCQSTTTNPSTASYDDAVLIMPMNGSNGGTTFTDISASGHTPSSVAGNTNTSTAQSKFYGSSGYFDGTGDYLDMGDSDDWIPQLGWTVEMWVYITGGTGTQRSLISQAGEGGSNQSFQILIQGTNKFACSIRNNSGNDWADANSNSAIPENQWVHLAVVVESGGTVKLYVDGTAQTETATFQGTGYNTSEEMWIGGQAHPSYPAYFTGYMNDVAMYQTAKYTSNFTPTTTGLLNSQPSIPAAVSPGNVSIKQSGVTAATFNPFNTDINTLRGQETAYATWNPNAISASNPTLSDGNLSFTGGGSDPNKCLATTPMSSGKFYAEFTVVSGSINPGLATKDITLASGFLGDNAYGWTYGSNGKKYHDDAVATGATYGDSYTNGDAIGVAFDADNGILTFYKNGVSQGAAYTGLTSGPYFFATGGSNMSHRVNFGQKPFKFPPPDGFQPLNTANTRPETVISRPNQYVGVATYTSGNGSAVSIDSYNFSPDLIFIKDRDDGNNWSVFDKVRGSGNRLDTTGQGQEQDWSAYFGSFDRNGFTVTDQTSDLNRNTNQICSWGWKAGGNKNTFNVDDLGYANASDVNMSVGALNSASYNTSNRWSDDYAGAAIDSSYPITQAFDGNRNTASRVSATQTAMSVDLTGITVTNKIEVCGELNYITPYVSVTVGGVTHQIGGDPNTLISGSAGTTTRVITGVSGALTNVTVGRVSSGRTFLSQIIVDGKILVDDNITPPNLPSIAPTGCSVGTKQGFSIISYTGTGSAGTLPHGLSKAPDLIIMKGRNFSDDWRVYHKDLDATEPEDYYLILQSQNGKSADQNASFMNDNAPTNTVFSLGTDSAINGSTRTMIAYCWHDVPGLQKFGAYKGSGQPFIELGFRPAVLIIKSLTGSRNWVVWDSNRSKHNPSRRVLLWNDSSNEANNSVYDIDFVSNGFKIQGSNSQIKGDNDYVYMAWAEEPSVNLFGGGGNAR